MFFDNLGIGELGVVLALVVVLVRPKELGKVMREFGKFKRKVVQIQSDVKSQIDSITAEAEALEQRTKLQNDKAGMRKWAKERVGALPAGDRAQASKAAVEQLAAWQTYKNAKAVACFAGTLEEIDTEPLLQRILADGKTLLLPYVVEADGKQTMAMAPVADLEKDLVDGTFGIREPKPELRNGGASGADGSHPGPDLALVPGLCFDERGGRLGKGLGFYDRYLTGSKAVKAGLCFDVQITQKNLALDPHDQMMDAVVSEKRILVFSAARRGDSQ